jgi:hypothetical protein
MPLRQAWDTVDTADVAVRVASQLRRMKKGAKVEDPAAIQRAIDFLDEAKRGGAIMAGEPAVTSGFGGELRPLNWATDAYLSQPDKSDSPELTSDDYKDIQNYLDRIQSTLEHVTSRGYGAESPIDDAVHFFEGLAEVLASRVDQRMMHYDPFSED